VTRQSNLCLYSNDPTSSVVWWSKFLTVDTEVHVRFLALPDFLTSSESGTEPTQPREYNWGVTWKKKWRLRSRKSSLWPSGPLRYHKTPIYTQKLALTRPTSSGHIVGIVRSRTKAMELLLLLLLLLLYYIIIIIIIIIIVITYMNLYLPWNWGTVRRGRSQ
jgi:hypothetical protein